VIDTGKKDENGKPILKTDVTSARSAGPAPRGSAIAPKIRRARKHSSDTSTRQSL
jgi:hypothetical protein